MGKFGKLFEEYVRKVIDTTELRYFAAKDIKQLMPSDQKSVDFLVIENDAAILIDAKGVEMSLVGRAALHPYEVIRATKDSVMKGIKQAFSVVQNLNRSNLDEKILENKRLYIVVITYKHLFVGNGATFYHSIAKTEIDKLAKEHDAENLVPIENMFFLSIDEFDLLVESHLATHHSLGSIFEKVIERNSSPLNMSMFFGWSLSKIYPDLKMPRFLDQEITRITENLK